MSAHTPGPWLLWDYPDPQQAIMGGGGFVAQTVGGNDEANARLIAAAPDLLAALKEAVQEQWDSCHAYGDPADPANTEGGAELYREWAAVVAKAEGRR